MRDIVARNLPPDDLDAFMMSVCASAEPWRVQLDDHYITRGGLEWGDAWWRQAPGCILEGEGTIELNPNIPDERLQVQSPIHLVPSARLWAQGLTGNDVVRAVPRGMTVRGLRFVLNHSKIAPQARRLGVSLRICAAVMQGNAATITRVKAVDCGAWNLESFPFVITGAQDGYDRHALSTVDASFEFDSDGTRSFIDDVEIDGFDPHFSNAQVSHAMIVGALCNDKLRDDGVWGEIGNWRQIYRRNPYINNVRGKASGDNVCQLATIYQCKGGEIMHCKSRGYHAGAYHDYFSSFDLDIHHNDFEAKRPVAFLLSPVDPRATGADLILPLQFSHDRPRVRSNTLSCLRVDDGWHAGVLAMKLENGGRRHIRSLYVGDNDISVVGGDPGRENYAVRAQGVDGLDVSPTNRINGFFHPYAIDRDCTDVKLPTIENDGCRWNIFRR